MAKGWGLADGLQSAGEDVAVLWGGRECSIGGVRHFNIYGAQLGPRDALIYYGGILGDALFCGAYDGLLSAGRRIWYPCYVHSYSGDFFDSIIIENPSFAEDVQSRSSARVVGCLFGCQHRTQREYENPYGPGRHLFFAGRLMARGDENQLAAMRGLIELLPRDFHIWIASSCVWVPVPGSASGINIHCPYGFCGRSGDPASASGGMLLRESSFRQMVDEMVGHSRIHFIGPMAYGSFDDYMFNAHCALDFGYRGNAHGPNSRAAQHGHSCRGRRVQLFLQSHSKA